MTQAHILALFTEAIADPRFPVAIGIAALSGLVRGFTGFGSALIYVPLISAVYSPRLAVPTLLLIDTVCGLPFLFGVFHHVNRGEVITTAIAGCLVLPLGMLALLWVDPLYLRWFISLLVLLGLVSLVSGWRYHGKPTLPASLAAGAMAGFGGGAAQIAAPPLLIFWLGGNNPAPTVRANIMAYFAIQGTLSIVLYAFNGLLNARALIVALTMGIPFIVALAAGAFYFHGSSDLLYRRAAYVIIAIAGLISLPLFDALR
jgi:uncharacterized membrane protein YfcA